MRFASFVLLLLVAPAVFAQADEPARQVLDDCVESVEHGVIGMDALETACPGLEAALVELGVASFLSEQQRELIGLPGLMNVQSLLQRYDAAPETDAVEVDSLRPVLDSLQQPVQAKENLSWFERFKRWLRKTIGAGSAADPSSSWLSRWLDEHRMSETARDVLFYGSVLLVVLLAIVVVVNELRVARKARRKSTQAQSPNEGIGADGKAVSSVDFDAAARDDRPSLVLRMLVATLVKTGRLRAERSLTHRELSATAKFDAAEQRECFHRIAELAERVVYGGVEVPNQDLDDVVQAGRALNSHLSGAAP